MSIRVRVTGPKAVHIPGWGVRQPGETFIFEDRDAAIARLYAEEHPSLVLVDEADPEDTARLAAIEEHEEDTEA